MDAVVKDKTQGIGARSRWRVRLAECWPVLLLAALGLLWSLSFWRHFVFPNSDYYSFVHTGRQWLSLAVPAGMKRAPVFSVLAGLVSMIFPQPSSQVAATEMYNALLLPASMILFYLIGRELLGRPAAMVTAFLAGISPWMIRMSSQPLAEMTLVVLFAAGVLCVARGRMGWAYAFAMLASVTRWDMAAMVPAVALADLLRNRRLRPVLWKAALASVPFLLCLGIMTAQSAGAGRGAHYLQVLSGPRQFALLPDLRLYWEAILSSVNVPLGREVAGRIQALQRVNTVIFRQTATLLALTFLWGSAAGLRRRRWEIFVVLVTGVPYVLVHAVWPFRLGRFCVPVAWAGLLIAVYGAKSILGLLRDRWGAWPRVTLVLQVALVVLLVVWATAAALTLFVHERTAGSGIEWVVYVSVAMAAGGYLGYEWVRAARPGLHWLVVPVFLNLAVLSSAAQTAVVMGNGRTLVNFKVLSLWFKENAGPNDRMVTNMPAYMPLYTGLPEDRFVHTGDIAPEAAPDFPRFVQECRRRGVTLIAWDSGLLDNTEDIYYKLWGLDRIYPLGMPFFGGRLDRLGDCELVHVIRDDWPWIAVWRITPKDGRAEPAAGGSH